MPPPSPRTDIPDLAGKTVIVTGANSGIGHAAAAALATAGAHVVLAVRDQAKGEAAAATMPGRPRSARSTSPASTRCAPSRPPGRATIDLLINNAGVMIPPLTPHRRRLRAAVRHQPPRPLRPHQSPAAARHRPRRHGVIGRPPGRRDRLRRPQLGAQAVPALARLRPVQAGQPAVHRRAPAAPDRGGLAGEGDRRAPRLRRHQSPVAQRQPGRPRSRWSSSATG